MPGSRLVRSPLIGAKLAEPIMVRTTGVVSGGNDEFTVLLLHCDGTDASTTFTDDSTGGVGSPHTVTANGNAQIDTAQSKFGGASGLFDGTGDYLSIPDSADWSLGTDDFTIDMWVRLNANTARYFILSQGNDVDNQMWLGLNMTETTSQGGLFFLVKSSGADVIRIKQDSNTGWDNGTWYHIAVTRNGSTYRIFRDGTQLATVENTDSLADFTSAMNIGRNQFGETGWVDFNGWLDEIRFSKDMARWTANFTPPTEAYS